MKYKPLLIFLALFCYGCVNPQRSSVDIDCPPLTDKSEILARISQGQSDLREFVARGSASVHLIEEDRTESLPGVTAYFSDRQNVVIRVSHTFGTAMLLGTNPQEFWCLIDFSKINDYYTGSIAQLESCGAKGLKTFPVAEALGIIDAASLEQSNIVFADSEYGLEIYDTDGSRLKSCMFDNCTSNLVRIKYYENDIPVVVADFTDYKQLNGNTYLPTDIQVYSTKDRLQLNIKVDRFIPLSLNQSKKDKLYSPPNSSSDANIYELDDSCQFRQR